MTGFFRDKREREELVQVALDLVAVMTPAERETFTRELAYMPRECVKLDIAVGGESK